MILDIKHQYLSHNSRLSNVYSTKIDLRSNDGERHTKIKINIEISSDHVSIGIQFEMEFNEKIFEFKFNIKVNSYKSCNVTIKINQAMVKKNKLE